MTTESKIITTISIITAIVFIGVVAFLSQDKTVATGREADAAVLNSRAGHTIISENAKVTITEFADFQCPACARTNPVLRQLMQEYQGRVNFVYRYFPLPQHINAIPSINAAEAAGEQGKYWEMADLLYKNQTSWAEQKNPKEVFMGFAKELGIDEVKFALAMDSGKFQDQIQKDLQDAKSLSVNSTPTLYINGVKVSGSHSYQDLKNQIETELKK